MYVDCGIVKKLQLLESTNIVAFVTGGDESKSGNQVILYNLYDRCVISKIVF